ncbi:MAG: hypothetical protein J6A90_00995 [Clostridia bacterium]|nr:hypothetical protein [Clostridia bacterium]
MRYEAPKYKKITIEVEDILSASGEIKVEQVSDGVADFILDAAKLFGLTNDL